MAMRGMSNATVVDQCVTKRRFDLLPFELQSVLIRTDPLQRGYGDLVRFIEPRIESQQPGSALRLTRAMIAICDEDAFNRSLERLAHKEQL